MFASVTRRAVTRTAITIRASGVGAMVSLPSMPLMTAPLPSASTCSVRTKSQSAAAAAAEENGNESDTDEVVGFPSDEKGVEIPVLLNSNQHAVGYLSKILNARVYEASVETELQHAKNLSAVSLHY